MAGVREALHNIYPNKVLKVDHEFHILPSKQFATDEAVVVVVRGTEVEVVYAIEYKPRVSYELHDQNPSHICEMFLQAFYLSTQCDHDIVHFSLLQSNSQHICIEWRHFVINTAT